MQLLISQENPLNLVQKKAVLGLIHDSLSLFGDNTKTALLVQMQKEGVVFTPDKFDIDKFCRVIQDLLGNHAEFIIVKIADDFCKQSGATIEEVGLSTKGHHNSNAAVLQLLFRKAELQV
jgi:hypothetical protein